MKHIAKALAVLLFSVAVYRAWTQSITHDEALTWRMYILTPLSSLTENYDANHHILHTWLVRLVTSIVGVSEFTLRLPALAGAALYLWTLVRLGGLLFGQALLAPATVFLLGAAPILMDFQVAARGYGLALALFLFALERLTAALLTAASRRGLWTAGAAMGLSIGANMVLVLPVAAACATFMYLWRPPESKREPKRKRRPATAQTPAKRDLLTALAAALLLFLLLAPLKHMLKRDLYYVGQQTLALSLIDLGANTLAHNEGLARSNMWVVEHDAVKKSFGLAIYPAVLLLGLAAGWRRKNERDPARRGAVLFFFSSIAIGAWILLVALHLVTGFPYPTDHRHLPPASLPVDPAQSSRTRSDSDPGWNEDAGHGAGCLLRSPVPNHAFPHLAL